MFFAERRSDCCDFLIRSSSKYKTSVMMHENEISGVIIDKAIKIHKALGPGLLESSYKSCLAFELERAGLAIQVEKALPLVYEEVRLECGYRLDILVENKVIIEIKAVETINDVHVAQLLTYLKLSGCKLGLLMNFNVLKIIHGTKRLVNNL